MTSTTLILIAGSAVFAITTLAALWTGYLLMQQWWVAENPELTDADDQISPLIKDSYPQQRDESSQTRNRLQNVQPIT